MTLPSTERFTPSDEDLTLSVLCVDDDKLNCEIMRILLEDVIQVPHVSFVHESKIFQSYLSGMFYKPSLIFMSLQMKPWTGYDLLAWLKSQEEFKDIRVVAVTAHVMNDEVQKMKEAGFAGLIAKPIVRKHFPYLFHRLLMGDSIWYVS